MTELIVGAVELNLASNGDVLPIDIERDGVPVGGGIAHRGPSISLVGCRARVMMRMSFRGGEKRGFVGLVLVVVGL